MKTILVEIIGIMNFFEKNHYYKKEKLVHTLCKMELLYKEASYFLLIE